MVLSPQTNIADLLFQSNCMRIAKAHKVEYHEQVDKEQTQPA